MISYLTKLLAAICFSQWEFFKKDTGKIAYLAKNRFPSN